ncbi:MAG: ADP-ribosylglycohydrolase family protein [Candidatus Hodarchaeota archaeon]
MKTLTYQEYYDRVLGSWIGRVAGDFVGAPVEFRPYSIIKEKYGNITYFPEPIDLNFVNDDEMYEICALIALETRGINLTAEDIAQEWLNLLYKLNFTAEEIALKNLRAGIRPPESGTHNNFYYDAIGAQMRADIWGQIAPGCPEIAKKYSELDGSISHKGIGIEGEVFIAVLLAQAFFENNIRTNIEIALKSIPKAKESLYTQMVRKALEIYELYPNDFRKSREVLINYWDEIKKHKLSSTGVKGSLSESILNRKRKVFLKRFSGVHVLPNIGIIILSLLYGDQDKEDPLGKSICTAAMMGLDTDCNCGNIGAIIGAQIGVEEIPSKWKNPLKDTFSTYVKGYEKWKITELAQRIATIGKKVVREKCQDKIKIID